MMSLSVVLASPAATVRLYGPPGAVTGRVARQWPEASAVTATVWPFSETLTDEEGAAVPQTGMGAPRCRTA